MPRITLAGAVTIDRYPDGERPGGSVLYGGRALEGDAILVTACRELPVSVCRVLHQTASSTVTFENRYDAQERVAQWVHAPAPTVSVHVPSGTELLILAPVLGELDLAAWVDAAPDAMVTLGAQGMLRSAPVVPGPVVPTEWRPSDHVLERLDAVFLSVEDVRHQPELVPHLRRFVPLVVVTAGSEGATAFAAGRTLHVPARRVSVVDPTGAGDTFHAVAAARLASGWSLEDALDAAARAAARCVGEPIVSWGAFARAPRLVARESLLASPKT